MFWAQGDQTCLVTNSIVSCMKALSRSFLSKAICEENMIQLIEMNLHQVNPKIDNIFFYKPISTSTDSIY